MLINFNEKTEQTVPGMNKGIGEMSVKMYVDQTLKIIPCKLHPGGSIGLHQHPVSDDINYILSGVGTAICDGREEHLAAGMCHICRKGSTHSIINTGDEDLTMLTIVVER